jgi:hypothetical protein
VTVRFKGGVAGYGRIETPEAASFDFVATRKDTPSRWKKFSRTPGGYYDDTLDANYSEGY